MILTNKLKSELDEQDLPGSSGWVKCTEGIDPPPKLEAVGMVVQDEHAELPSGVLPVVLTFLQRCEDDTFAKVLLDAGGGNLRSSATWINILLRVVPEESSRLQVAQNIGPLIRCMCNDTKRMFFKSNKQWRDGILPFVKLISKMMNKWSSTCYTQNEFKIIKVLLQHDEFLPSIIQWGFWDEERPDLVHELYIGECNTISTFGRDIIWKIARAIDQHQHLEDGKSLLEIIGTTPIISIEYDPTCKISCVEGFIRQMKANQRYIFTTLKCLIGSGDCVDEGVIREMVDYGSNFVYDESYSLAVCESISVMMLKKTVNDQILLCDTRVAFAVGSGLIEMCLGMIIRFGTHETFHDGVADYSHLVDGTKLSLERLKNGKLLSNEYSLFQSIQSILISVYDISLHQKTAKAIRSKKSAVKERLSVIEQSPDITNDLNCTKLLVIIKSILNLNGSYCCRCNGPLSRTEVKLCNGCGCMAYCSRACQEKDWLSGHKLMCSKPFTKENSGQFQGRILPQTIPNDERGAIKLKELEINMSMIQLKLFLDNSERILSQARALVIPLYDLVVVFELLQCPPKTLIPMDLIFEGT